MHIKLHVAEYENVHTPVQSYSNGGSMNMHTKHGRIHFSSAVRTTPSAVPGTVPHKNCSVGLCLPAFRLTVCPSKTVQFNYGHVQTHVMMSQLFKNWIIFVLDVKLIDLQLLYSLSFYS